jgi:drug/metabolite transporter (DMT)-like permease
MKVLSASTSSVIGMLEPVVAGVVCLARGLGESLDDAIQLFGGAIVLTGIYLADRAKRRNSSR